MGEIAASYYPAIVEQAGEGYSVFFPDLREFALYGFCRRLGTLIRAIDQVYDILPPEREDIPERDEVIDAISGSEG